MEARSYRTLSVDEYVSLDRADQDRWEYVNGDAHAMAGGSPEHALVAGNLFHDLKSALVGAPCLAFHEAQKIATVRTRAYHYPDASIVCPPFVRDTKDDHALTSPSALFEVLSNSTRDYDQGGKFVHYRSIDTLHDYVLVDPDARELEHRRRVAVNQWLSTFVRAGEIEFAVGIKLAITPLFRDIEKLSAR